MPTTDDAVQMRGMTAVASDGDKLGKIEDIYLDQETGKPEWMALKTGLFGGHLSFVPLAAARRDGDTITVPYDKARVKDAPRVDGDGQLSQREEVRIEREPVTDANADEAMGGPAISEEEHEVVLHEEQPVVEKRAVPKERVRLDKDVVRDEHTVSDEVRKEQIDVDGDRA